jgi:hypothetical protein
VHGVERVGGREGGGERYEEEKSRSRERTPKTSDMVATAEGEMVLSTSVRSPPLSLGSSTLFEKSRDVFTRFPALCAASTDRHDSSSAGWGGVAEETAQSRSGTREAVKDHGRSASR